MLKRFAPLFPRRDTHLLLSRAGGGDSPFSLDGVDVRAGAPDILESFTTEFGFPAGWAGEMLTEGAQPVIACDASTGATLAMAWATTRPFFVEEIGATIDPGEGGVYLFGDYVAPAARGRRLQRLLVAERLRRAGPDARACTIVHPTNEPSMRSYRHEGFMEGGRFTRTWWLGRNWGRCSGPNFTLRDGTLRLT
jgi:ribosomal protein S18 acetylase RimI-like enzyme